MDHGCEIALTGHAPNKRSWENPDRVRRGTHVPRPKGGLNLPKGMRRMRDAGVYAAAGAPLKITRWPARSASLTARASLCGLKPHLTLRRMLAAISSVFTDGILAVTRDELAQAARLRRPPRGCGSAAERRPCADVRGARSARKPARRDADHHPRARPRGMRSSRPDSILRAEREFTRRQRAEHRSYRGRQGAMRSAASAAARRNWRRWRHRGHGRSAPLN